MNSNQKFTLYIAIIIAIVVICTVSVVKTGNLCLKYRNEKHSIEITTETKSNDDILDSNIEKRQQKNDK